MITLNRKNIESLLKGMSLFEKRVLRRVASIPLGETRSYSWIAKESGYPKRARAVGRVLSKNPYPLIIPCHRVIRSNGETGEYIFGEKFKRELLDLEKRVKSVIMIDI